jgi:FSR family fosmidomycin resistance protein-like MFS transporter
VAVDRVNKDTVRPNRGHGQHRTALYLALGHAVDDFYPSFLAPLLPLFVETLGLSLASAGALATLQSLTTSLIQPLFGYFADRVRRPTLVAWAVLASAVFTSLWGLATSGPLLIFLIVLAGLSVALFHPVAGALAGQAATSAEGRRRKGLVMSLFVTGGIVGYGVGPLTAVALVSRWGLPALALAVVPGILTAILLHRFAQSVPTSPATSRRLASFPKVGGSLILLTFVVALRAVLAITMGTFLPLYLSQRGASLMLGGLAVSVFRVAGALGGLVGGPLSDRIGRKQVLFLSFALALPFLWGFFQTNGWVALGLLAAAGAVITSSAPVNVLIAQEAAPDNPGMASGLMMGFAWGLGGLAVTGVGWWGDRVGLPTAFSATVIVAAVLAAVVTLSLREGSTQPRALAGDLDL